MKLSSIVSKMTGISHIKMDLGLLITLTLLSTGLQAAKWRNWETKDLQSGEWGYWGKKGPENWPGICITGKKQSPIDISTEDAVKIDLGPLNFDRYNVSFRASLENDGHSVEIELHGVPPHLSGANLKSEYVFEQMHLHWPSEHTVDGLHGPLELHLVHYNKQYENFSIAVQHDDGVAVVSVLFELSRYDNPELKPIVKATKEALHRIRKITPIQEKLTPSLFLPTDHSSYYHYQGSLTTPACQESVMWFVLKGNCPVSKAQVNVFKRLKGDHGIVTFNNRPTQELNDRKVYHHLG